MKNNVLKEMRYSFFKEEFYDNKKIYRGPQDDPVIKHDMLDHKIEEVKDSSPIVKDLKKLVERTFPSEIGSRKTFTFQRLFRYTDLKNQYVVEFGYGLNGGSPNYRDDKPHDEKLSDNAHKHKWIWYVDQIKQMMEAMYWDGYDTPRLVWIEDPDHSDCYSCYIEFHLEDANSVRKESKQYSIVG